MFRTKVHMRHAPEIKPEQAIAPEQKIAHEIEPLKHSLGKGDIL
jgi:hypothetical protein